MRSCQAAKLARSQASARFRPASAHLHAYTRAHRAARSATRASAYSSWLVLPGVGEGGILQQRAIRQALQECDHICTLAVRDHEPAHEARLERALAAISLVWSTSDHAT